MKKYSSTKCPFCKGKLAKEMKQLYCPDNECSEKYSYVFDTVNKVSWFIINGYKFAMYPDGMEIQEPQPKAIETDYVLDITPENYLEQIGRVKKLQAFS